MTLAETRQPARDRASAGPSAQREADRLHGRAELNMALSVADYIYVVNKGTAVWEGLPDELRHNEEVKQKWLGV